MSHALPRPATTHIYPLSLHDALPISATPEQLIKYTKRSLLILTGLMIIFGMLRTEQAAWWNILAWTMRNSATFAPVIAVLFWRLATKEAVVGSMILGFLSGIAWYHLGGWSPDVFYLNVHPVWIGMSVNILTIILITLLQEIRNLSFNFSLVEARVGHYALTAVIVILSILLINFDVIHSYGLTGLLAFAAVLSLFISTVVYIPKTKDEAIMRRKLAKAK